MVVAYPMCLSWQQEGKDRRECKWGDFGYYRIVGRAGNAVASHDPVLALHCLVQKRMFRFHSWEDMHKLLPLSVEPCILSTHTGKGSNV